MGNSAAEQVGLFPRKDALVAIGKTKTQRANENPEFHRAIYEARRIETEPKGSASEGLVQALNGLLPPQAQTCVCMEKGDPVPACTFCSLRELCAASLRSLDDTRACCSRNRHRCINGTAVDHDDFVRLCSRCQAGFDVSRLVECRNDDRDRHSGQTRHQGRSAFPNHAQETGIKRHPERFVGSKPANVPCLGDLRGNRCRRIGHEEVSQIKVIMRRLGAPRWNAMDVDVERPRSRLVQSRSDSGFFPCLARRDERSIHFSRITMPSRLQPQVEFSVMKEQHLGSVAAHHERRSGEVTRDDGTIERMFVGCNELPNSTCVLCFLVV